jgi:hypothetical protein
VANPTSHDHDPAPRWWLALDDGEHLAIDDTEAVAGDSAREQMVQLRLPAWRARDLGSVLAAYTRMVALVSDAAEVSGTEAPLASALRTAADTCSAGTAATRNEPRPISTGDRLRAMAVVQTERPTLTHSALVGVVDAAARWLEDREPDLAAGLLEAAAGDDAGRRAWELLQGVDRSDDPGS